MANRRYNQFYYTLHKMPVRLDCNFVVDSTNGNGLGIRSLKGAGIEDVFMHTSATPGAGNSGAINPNPSAGIIKVVLEDNYQYYIGGYAGFVSPVSASNLAVNGSALTVGAAYVIVSLGNTSAAKWITLGVPIGTTPAVGLAFIAAVVGDAGAGSGLVRAPKAGYSGIDHIEVFGDPNLSIQSSIGAQTGASPGPYIIMSCLFEGALTAPSNEAVIGMSFEFQNSAIINQGY